MKIAELFVGLGVKGGQTVKNTLVGVMRGLQDTKEMSLSTKAGIFGAVVALEELTRRSVGAAVDLKNFAGATGLSTMELQKWGYWAEINDVKAEEMAGTIRGLQSAQSALRLGQGVPAGAVYFGLNQNNNPIEMMNEIQKKLRQIGNDQKEIGNARTMAATLGITDTMFAGLRIGTLGFAGLTKEMVLTQKEQEKLLKLNREWNTFWLTLKGTTQKTVANDLSLPIQGMVHTLSNAVREGAKLIKMFSDMVNDKHNWDSKGFTAGMVALGATATAALIWIAPFTAALLALVAALDQLDKIAHGKDSWLQNIFGEKRDIVGPPNMQRNIFDPTRDDENVSSAEAARILGLDKIGGGVPQQVQAPTSVVVNSHIEGVSDPKTAVDMLMKEISGAYWQTNNVNNQWATGQ